MATIRAREPGWADVLEDNAAEWATARRLVGQLAACEAAALAFCRLLERWARGDAYPSTAGARDAALRHAADRAETALAGLDRPLDRYLLELESDRAEGRSWYGGPGAGELLEWEPILKRAGVPVCPTRVAQAYLELAVLVRALQGLADMARIEAVPDSSTCARTSSAPRSICAHSPPSRRTATARTRASGPARTPPKETRRVPGTDGEGTALGDVRSLRG
jgi:hypothetical protein